MSAFTPAELRLLHWGDRDVGFKSPNPGYDGGVGILTAAKTRAMWAGGATDAEIAARACVCLSAVSAWRRRNGRLPANRVPQVGWRP